MKWIPFLHTPCIKRSLLQPNVDNSPIPSWLDFWIAVSTRYLFGWRTGIYKSFLHQIGSRGKTTTSPRIPSGGHYSKLFMQRRRWAEWGNDFNIAEREQLQHSAVGGWQISFPLPHAQSLILSFSSLFCSPHFLLLLLFLVSLCLFQHIFRSFPPSHTHTNTQISMQSKIHSKDYISKEF